MITLKLKEKAEIVNAIIEDFGTDPNPNDVLKALDEHMNVVNKALEKAKANLQASKELVREYKREIKKSQVKAIKMQTPKLSDQSALLH